MGFPFLAEVQGYLPFSEIQEPYISKKTIIEGQRKGEIEGESEEGGRKEIQVIITNYNSN